MNKKLQLLGVYCLIAFCLLSTGFFANADSELINDSNCSKTVELPYSISKNEKNEFILAGQTTILWTDYNVEDPSIFIAKVDPAVWIDYSLRLAQP